MKTTSTINWLPFSEKHRNYILKTKDCKANVAEGAVRAAKTICNCIAFGLCLEYTKDKIHLASGSTIANAKLNVGDCNGFGLEYQFRGRCRWGKYKENDALFINTKTGEKIVIFAGGGKADSYKKILGNSYGLWIATEINEHYDCEDSKTSFIKVAMARQLASINPKWFWDLNPDDPTATIYRWYLDIWDKNGLVGGYNYQHFTIYNNAAITDERKAEIISQYDQTSIWYQRDILGARVVAEGRIYKEFKEYHIIKMSEWNHRDEYGRYDNEIRKNIKFINIGVDFGGTGSAHSFNATAYCINFTRFGTIKQKRIPEKINASELNKSFLEFVLEVRAEYPDVPILDIRCDSAEQVLIGDFIRILTEHNICIPINNAIKGEIKNRIRFYCLMFSTNKYFILECCEPLILAFKTSVWEKNKIDVRLDDGLHDIDSLDAQEYSTEPYQDILVQIN